MGAGIDPKRLYRLQYRQLKTLERRLLGLGVSAKYQNREVVGSRFRAYFSCLGPASNGESFHYLVIRFNPQHQPQSVQKHAGDEDYVEPQFTPGRAGGVEQGIARILTHQLTHGDTYGQ